MQISNTVVINFSAWLGNLLVKLTWRVSFIIPRRYHIVCICLRLYLLAADFKKCLYFRFKRKFFFSLCERMNKYSLFFHLIWFFFSHFVVERQIRSVFLLSVSRKQSKKFVCLIANQNRETWGNWINQIGRRWLVYHLPNRRGKLKEEKKCGTTQQVLPLHPHDDDNFFYL